MGDRLTRRFGVMAAVARRKCSADLEVCLPQEQTNKIHKCRQGRTKTGKTLTHSTIDEFFSHFRLREKT
jgi:hypothetical protein